MTLARILLIAKRRLLSMFRKERLDDELDRELDFHLDLLVQEKIDAGVDAREARLEAMREIGNLSVFKEECRDQRRVGWFHDFYQDLRYGLRMMRKRPGLTAIAAVSLAFGIGTNAAVLSVGASLALDDLPLPGSDRLFALRSYLPGLPRDDHPTIPEYVAWKERATSFQAMGASISNQLDIGEDHGGGAERLSGQAVTPSVFDTLGVAPLAGRVFEEHEARVGEPAAPVIVLSHRLWQRRFGGDPRIVGSQVRLSGRSLTVIGVMPSGFWYPNEVSEYWVPLAINTMQLQNSARFFFVTGRLKDGASRERAGAELAAISAQLAVERAIPPDNRWTARIVPLRAQWFGWLAQPLVLLEAAVAMVLLMACANVSSLLLGRVPARRPEISMRLLMGAGRGRIFRQFLTESLLLSLAGGALGLLVAQWGIGTLESLNPPPGQISLPAFGETGGILGYTAMLSLVSTVLFGVLPAGAAFSSGNELRHAGAHGRHRSPYGALVSIQIALALTLLVASGLLVNSFVRLLLDDRAFDPNGVLAFQYRIPVLDYAGPAGYHHGLPVMAGRPPIPAMLRVYEKVRTLPGMESAAAASAQPVNGILVPTAIVNVEGRDIPSTPAERENASVTYFLITEDFFSTLKTPLVLGRDFDPRDTPGGPWTAVVNETLANRFWPGEDPLGKRFTVDAAEGESVREVIGVVRDIPLQYVRTGPPRPVAYTLYRQQPESYRGSNAGMFGQMTFFLRTEGDPMNMVPAVRRAVAEVDPHHPPADFQPMTRMVGAGMQNRRYLASVLGTFALMATILAGVGVYGIMALSVSQRTREIGIRMALGAPTAHIVGAVGGRALRWIAVGVIGGLAGSLAIGRLIEVELWGVTPTDLPTYAAVTAFLAAVAGAACFIPARRAMRVDANEALRMD